MQGGRTIRTAKNRENFLLALAGTANVVQSCRIARIGRTAAFAWRNDDKQFAKDWERALQEGMHVLEAEAVRRAVAGVVKPIFYKGQNKSAPSASIPTCC